MAFWGKKKRQPPAITCYGKLPATGDFIRLNASGPESAAFDNWLASSLATARESMGDAFMNCYKPALGMFIYRGPDGSGGEEPDRGLVGVWASSGDSAGRRYPMMVAASYDYQEIMGCGAGLPLAVWPFLSSAYDLVANGRGLSVEAFLQKVSQLKLVSLDDPDTAIGPYQRWLQNSSMEAFWMTGFGTVERRYDIIHNIQANVEIFSDQERPQTQLALRFPINAGDAFAAAVWTDITVRLAKWKETLLSGFWTPHHDLMLHLGPPQVGTFREMISNGTDAEQVTDLTKPPTTNATTARQRLGKLAIAVDDLNQSVASFLQQL